MTSRSRIKWSNIVMGIQYMMSESRHDLIDPETGEILIENIEY
jgi:hypothetical protein